MSPNSTTQRLNAMSKAIPKLLLIENDSTCARLLVPGAFEPVRAETLADGLPICFACHMSNVLVREHPELVVDRHRTADRGRH